MAKPGLAILARAGLNHGLNHGFNRLAKINISHQVAKINFSHTSSSWRWLKLIHKIMKESCHLQILFEIIFWCTKIILSAFWQVFSSFLYFICMDRRCKSEFFLAPTKSIFWLGFRTDHQHFLWHILAVTWKIHTKSGIFSLLWADFYCWSNVCNAIPGAVRFFH